MKLKNAEKGSRHDVSHCAIGREKVLPIGIAIRGGETAVSSCIEIRLTFSAIVAFTSATEILTI